MNVANVDARHGREAEVPSRLCMPIEVETIRDRRVTEILEFGL